MVVVKVNCSGYGLFLVWCKEIWYGEVIRYMKKEPVRDYIGSQGISRTSTITKGIPERRESNIRVVHRVASCIKRDLLLVVVQLTT